jgi:hypothetical protein
LALLKESRLDPALIEQVSQALEQIDLGRFAPGGQATVASFLHDVQKLINSLENGFKKLEVKSQK